MTADTPDTPAPAYLILGATGGIGSALTRRLASRGARLGLLGRHADRLADAASSIEQAESIVGDATDFDAVTTAARQTVERFGRLDGIVNAVGSIVLKPAHRTSAEVWRQTIDLNLTSGFAAVRAAAETFDAKQGGCVVLISSTAARIGLANHDAIAAAKAGLIGLAQATSATYASRRLRVNVVAPGLVDTPMAAPITGNDAARKYSESLHPLGRLGEAGEIAACIDWLLGPDAQWVTGQTFGVDGGLSRVVARSAG